LKTKAIPWKPWNYFSCTTWTFLVQNQDDDDQVVLELPCLIHQTQPFLVCNTTSSKCPGARQNALHYWVATNIENIECPWHQTM